MAALICKARAGSDSHETYQTTASRASRLSSDFISYQRALSAELLKTLPKAFAPMLKFCAARSALLVQIKYQETSCKRLTRSGLIVILPEPQTQI
jgi:hypothetical protein